MIIFVLDIHKRIIVFFFFWRNRSKFDEIDMKFNNVFVKENFEEDFLSK
jgi:hypothetical protein